MSNEIKQRPIQLIELKKLKLNPKNPRKNDGAVDAVVKSIKKFGFNVPLFCDTSFTVYCGNTRLKAARKLKLKAVPCIIADDLSADEIREYALIDNKASELAEWDTELLEQELAELDMSDWETLNWQTGEGISPDEYSTAFSLPNGEKGEICQMTFTLHEKQAEAIREALKAVMGDVTETFGNQNSNGNALYEVVRQWEKLRT